MRKPMDSGYRAIVAGEAAKKLDEDPLEDYGGEDVALPESWNPTADDIHSGQQASRGVVEAVSARVGIHYTPSRFPKPAPIPREMLPWYSRFWRWLWS